ncbi:MAG: type II toxin-antitoxin system Phd/YefM family antitoxin [Acidobacteriota bacterium]
MSAHPKTPPGTGGNVRIIPAGEFKAKCLQLMDQVRDNGLTIIVTKRGQPVSHVVPPVKAPAAFESIVGRHPGVEILGDIVSPLPEEWTLPEWAWEKPKPKRARKKK